jgi:hypothetical protein
MVFIFFGVFFKASWKRIYDIFLFFLKIYGPNSLQPVRKFTNFIIAKDKDMMRFAAINEILLMPCIVVMIFRFVVVSRNIQKSPFKQYFQKWNICFKKYFILF